MDPFTAVGTWWLPERSEDRVGGTLNFERGTGGLRLRLIGSLNADPSVSTELVRKYPIIFGETIDGEPITLRDTRVISSHAILQHLTEDGPKRLESHELDAEEAFYGAHLPLGAETPVRGVTIDLHLLDDWAWARQPFVEEMPTDDPWRRQVLYRIPSPVEFEAFGGTARLGADLNWSSVGWHDESVKRPAHLFVEFNAPVQYRNISEDVVKPFQYFLTFACGAPTHLKDLTIWVDGFGRQMGDAWVPARIKTARRDAELVEEKRPHWWDLLLPLWSIEERIGEVFARWSDLLGHAESALDLFCGISLGPSQYLETRFLFAIQALEVYHRRCPWFTNKLMATDEWRTRWNMLLAAAKESDADLGQWVQERRSEFGNEPRLHDRLTELVTHGGEHAIRVLRTDFVYVATKTRHRLTHYDPSRKGADGVDLYWLAEEAMALMEACLLRDLGLTPEEIVEATSRTQRTRDLLSHR